MAIARPHAEEPVEARTAKLVKQPNGFWKIVYTERDPVTGAYRQRPHSCRTRDAQKARLELEEWRRQVCTIGAQQAQVTPTIQPIIEGWLEDIARSHPDRGKAQRWAATAPRRLLGDKLPSELSDDVIHDYIAKRHSARPGGFSTGTLRAELNVIVIACNWAKKKGLIADTPKIELPPEAPPRDVWLDEATEARVHAAALAELYDPPGTDPREQRGNYAAALFLLIALNTAARRDAILELTWDRTNLATGLIDFRVPGRRTTRKKRVSLPIAPRLEPVLEHAWVQAQAQGATPASRVLATHRFINNNVARFSARHGVPELTPHVCRHTWATLAARRSEDMYVIANVLGDNIGTVTKHYMGHAPEHLRRALARNGLLPV